VTACRPVDCCGVEQLNGYYFAVLPTSSGQQVQQAPTFTQGSLLLLGSGGVKFTILAPEKTSNDQRSCAFFCWKISVLF